MAFHIIGLGVKQSCAQTMLAPKLKVALGPKNNKNITFPPPSPNYNVDNVNESQSHLILFMLKLQRSQISQHCKRGRGGRLLVIAIKACTPYTTDKTKSSEDADSCTKQANLYIFLRSALNHHIWVITKPPMASARVMLRS